MPECAANHPALPVLFAKTVPNPPVLWSVLEGRHSGRAFVDNLEAPTQCLLRTDAVLTFSSRQISQIFLEEAIDYFRQRSQIWLVWSDHMPTGIKAPKADLVGERLEFFDIDSLATTLITLRECLPDGFALRLIDRALLERCEWRDEMAFFCGGLESFLTNGIGLCLLQGDEIIVEAYASSLGAGQAEIGAITRKAYRGKGYAPVACAYLIEICTVRGYRVYWSCERDNQSSIRVAQKLGFRGGKPYQIFEYSIDD